MIRARAAITCIGAAVATLSMAVFGTSAAQASSVPFTDTSANGTVTLCNTLNQAVSSGNIHTKPFVWRAVGSAVAQKPYSKSGGTATLFAFEPLQGVDPSLWQGWELTGAAKYSDPSSPTAAATAADQSLADYLALYPPGWNGMVQLRLLLGAPYEPTNVSAYSTAVIRISGDTWTLLEGGTSGCGIGTAVSNENILPSVAALGTPAPNATTIAPAKSERTGSTSRGASATPNHSGSGAAGTPASSPAHPVTSPTSSRGDSSNSSAGSLSSGSETSSEPALNSSTSGVASAVTTHKPSAMWAFVLGGLVVVFGGVGGAVWWRRRTGRLAG